MPPGSIDGTRGKKKKKNRTVPALVERYEDQLGKGPERKEMGMAIYDVEFNCRWGL